MKNEESYEDYYDQTIAPLKKTKKFKVQSDVMSVIDNFEKMQNTSIHQELFSSKGGSKSQNEYDSAGYLSDSQIKKNNLIEGRLSRKH